jgi:hypothetical protein
MQVHLPRPDATFDLTLTGPHARLFREEALVSPGRFLVCSFWSRVRFMRGRIVSPLFGGNGQSHIRTSVCRRAFKQNEDVLLEIGGC